MNPSSRKKPRILIVGDATTSSGFSRVIRGIFGPLRHAFDLHQLALGYRGDPHTWPWPLYPAGAYNNPLGYDRLAAVAAEIRPDLVFLLHEPSVTARWLQLLDGVVARERRVAYVAVEAGPISRTSAEGLQRSGRLIAYTEFARRRILECLPASTISSPPIDVLPHGVDTRAFRPAVPRRDARRALGLPEHSDGFIVLNANRNQPRKAIDATIAGFALFAQGKPPGVKLFLHMGLRDLGWNLITLCRRHGIMDRCIFFTNSIAPPAVPDATLNLIYNACDVGINTSMCEGWGLVSFEHAATGAAQIVPRHTACEELWAGSALMLEPSVSIVHPATLEEAFVVAPSTVAAALERVYTDPVLLKQLSSRGRAMARRPEFRWSRISRDWRALFEQQLAAASDHVA